GVPRGGAGRGAEETPEKESAERQQRRPPGRGEEKEKTCRQAGPATTACPSRPTAALERSYPAPPHRSLRHRQAGLTAPWAGPVLLIRRGGGDREQRRRLTGQWAAASGTRRQSCDLAGHVARGAPAPPGARRAPPVRRGG